MKKIIVFCIFIIAVLCISYLFFIFVQAKKSEIDWGKLQYLGFKTIDELNLKKEKTNIGNEQSHLKKRFHNFLYRDKFIIQTEEPADILTLSSNPSQNWDLYYTLRALEKIFREYPDLYFTLIESFFDYSIPDNYDSKYRPWINRYEKIIISFNSEMDSIASNISLLDETPLVSEFRSKKIKIYKNFLIIYINRKVIHEKDEFIGAYPYFKLETDEENYYAYMNEGLVHTILHELTHGLIHQYNYKIGSLYSAFAENDQFFGSSKDYDKDLYDFEEILVIRTLNNYFEKHQVGSKIIRFASQNTEAYIKNKIGKTKLLQYREQFRETENFISDDSLDIFEK